MHNVALFWGVAVPIIEVSFFLHHKDTELWTSTSSCMEGPMPHRQINAGERGLKPELSLTHNNMLRCVC